MFSNIKTQGEFINNLNAFLAVDEIETIDVDKNTYIHIANEQCNDYFSVNEEIYLYFFNQLHVKKPESNIFIRTCKLDHYLAYYQFNDKEHKVYSLYLTKSHDLSEIRHYHFDCQFVINNDFTIEDMLRIINSRYEQQILSMLMDIDFINGETK